MKRLFSRSPFVVSVEKRRIKTIRHTVVRWYVTLDFGGVQKKLAVSEPVARWLEGL